jgi:hypothetical protein
MTRRFLAALLTAAPALTAPALTAPALTGQTPFTLTAPTFVDFSQLPRTSTGAYVVTFTGTGFTSPMLLVARVGPIGPLVVAHQLIDAQTITVQIQSPSASMVGFELYKLGTNSLLVSTPRLHTQFVVGPPAGGAFYVATNGSDGHAGTQAAPFRTIGRGLQALAPGGTLFLRGGTYFERPSITAGGTAEQPITIRSFPGERAVIDSGPTAFRTAGNQDWELVDAATGEYQSVGAVPFSTPYGYVLGIPGYENGRVGLVPYVDGFAFRSTSESYVDPTTPFYVGPGLYADPDSGRLHVRLQKTADVRRVEARYGQVFAVDTPDPRNFAILVSQA